MTEKPRLSVSLGNVIFASRWLQAPLYLGLIVAQAIYVVVFLIDLWHLAVDVFTDLTHLNESTIMLAVLGLIDVVMIANLLIMVIMGGYEIFVSKLGVSDHPDEPDWLNHVNANVLKVKLAISIISISSIHLLRTFIEVGDLGASSDENVTGEQYTSEGVFWQVVIHLAFIVSALALAWIDKMSQQHQVQAA
ncbi:MAG: TIGR00645 family protein, partial [Microbacterium sp.]